MTTTETTSTLEEIFIKPSNEIIEDRFNPNKEDNTVDANCCHGLG